MCPITDSYIKNEYIDVTSDTAVRVDGVLEKVLIVAAKRVLNKNRHGARTIFLVQQTKWC